MTFNEFFNSLTVGQVYWIIAPVFLFVFFILQSKEYKKENDKDGTEAWSLFIVSVICGIFWFPFVIAVVIVKLLIALSRKT